MRISNTTYNLDYATEDYAHVKPTGEGTGQSGQFRPDSLKDYKVKVKIHTLDTAPLCSESPSQKRSGMAHVLKGFHSFTCTPTGSSAIGMSHTCLCLPSRSWYSFTDPGGMAG